MKMTKEEAIAQIEKLKSYCEHMKDSDENGAYLFDLDVQALDFVLSILTPPNEWVSVYDRLPEPGERVLATDCGFVGEFYINKRGKWQRYNVNCSELLMALDILYWMPLPTPPAKGETDESNLAG